VEDSFAVAVAADGFGLLQHSYALNVAAGQLGAPIAAGFAVAVAAVAAALVALG